MFNQNFIVGFICILLAYGIFLYSAIKRLQKKLGQDVKPTLWTYANELGGYLVVGLLILIGMIYRIMS
ncbi:MAG: hypothetical protein HUJ26_13480 [Planctomycetaceae bacterium]|nr:hypothetical protein [Planctomycetaceae bacterium]